MRKRRPIPPIRLPLIAAVFVAGLWIGVLAIALSRHHQVHHVVVTRTVAGPSTIAKSGATATTSTSTPSTSTGPRRSSTETGADSTAAPNQSQPSHASVVLPGAASSFAALKSHLNGPVGLAVAPLGAGPVQTFGSVQIAHAWSTSKVPVLVTLLSTYEGLNRTLPAANRDEATLALTESDNAAIESLFSSLEQLRGGLVPASEAVQETFRKAGDRTAVVNTAPNDEGFTTYGQSEWSLRDEVIFYRALARGCLADQNDTSYVLGLMSNVIPSQRWGAGSAGYPSSIDLEFKGGWGPVGGDYEVRQTAIVGSGNQGYTMAMIALPASGSFTDGTNMLTALATWARQHFELGARRASTGCSGTL